MAIAKCLYVGTGENGLAFFAEGEIDTGKFLESTRMIQRPKSTGKGLHHPTFRKFSIVHVIYGIVEFSVPKSAEAIYPDDYQTYQVGEGKEYAWIIFDDQEPTPQAKNSGHRSDVPTNFPGEHAVQTATEFDRELLSQFFTPTPPTP